MAEVWPEVKSSLPELMGLACHRDEELGTGWAVRRGPKDCGGAGMVLTLHPCGTEELLLLRTSDLSGSLSVHWRHQSSCFSVASL